MDSVENPFVIGKVVGGGKFADRDNETLLLKRELDNNQNVIIVSPRRYGKTSLILHALQEAGKEYVYVDCSLANDEAGLLEQMLNNFVGNQPLEKLAAAIRGCLKDLELTIEVNPAKIKVKNVGSAGFEEVVKYVSSKIVVLDEFQEVVRISENLPKRLRAVIQHQRKPFVFLGSKRHMMRELFQNPNSAFYNSGVVLNLELIPPREFQPFITHWFKRTGVKLEDGDTQGILDFTHGHPYYTQYLCHFLWEKRRARDKATVDQVVSSMVEANSSFYESAYSSLNPNQRKALAIVAREKNVFSKQAMKAGKMNATQNLQKALASLANKEIIDKNGHYHFNDLLFRKWMLDRTQPN
ncbi:ATP-binding protein [Candidatus Micrarchaeota archaeon]|nr:ATP-binding protein [Candidatus Micrarchaeota archaeon]